MWEPKRSERTWTNKMSMMHYKMIADMYHYLFALKAFEVLDPSGKTQLVVPVSALIDVSCATMKADNPRFVDKLFVDACVGSK